MKHLRIISLFIFTILALVVSGCGAITPGPVGPGGDQNPSNYKFETPATDSLKLDAAWEGKNFLEDGIGEVKVSQNVDGDTTIFRIGSQTFSTRYLGVDTPESTYKVEPFGFDAAEFTKNKLKGAERIVLEAEGERTDGNGRYLAWVWYRNSEAEDFRLLNLEIIENAYSTSKNATTSKYGSVFLTADEACRAAKVRIFGEIDPKYDASEIGTPLTIKELRETYWTLNVAEQNSFKGKKIRIQGTVARVQGAGSAYIQQYDEATGKYYGVYVFGGYNETCMQLGYEVYVQGTIGYYGGALQVTSFDASNSGILSLPSNFENPETIYYEEITVNDFNTGGNAMQGKVVVLKNLTIKRYKDSQAADNFAFSLFMVDESGAEMEVRIPEDTTLKINGYNNGLRITSGKELEGSTVAQIIGVVGWYSYLNGAETEYGNDGLQLILVRNKDLSGVVKPQKTE